MDIKSRANVLVPARVGVKKLKRDVLMPERKSKRASGFDLHAYLNESVTLKSGERISISTGLALQIPNNCEGQVRPRSGLAIKHGVTVLNSPGTIDSDYTGEIKVILINHGSEDYIINPNDRIAQLVIVMCPHTVLEEVFELKETERGDKGFNSTGY